MKIGIDIRCLATGRRTGVEEYTLNLLNKIFEEDTTNEYILFLNSWKKPNIDSSLFKKNKNVKIEIFRFPNKILNLFFWYLHWPKIDEMLGGLDVVFMPSLNFIALSDKTKLVLTVHDLSFEYFPETFSLKMRLWHMFINPKKMIKRADKIIAISQSTKNDLVTIYGIGKEKITVIYNGVSDEFTKVDRNNPKLLEVKEKYGLPFNFILFLGTFEPRKNIVGVIEAYEILREKSNKNLDKYKLVIAGSEGWKSGAITKKINSSKFSEDIVWVKFIEDEDKVFIYNLAALFVYPSFFEGFGIPPVEAMRCGVNVVVSNNSSLIEVVGEGGIMVDADRADEIALACQELLLNKDLQEIIADKRFKQVQKFSWRISAKKIINIFNEIAPH